MRTSFLYNGNAEETPNLVLLKISLLKYLLLLLLTQASNILYQFQFLMKSCIISLVVNNVPVIEMRPEKPLYMVNSADLGRILQSLPRRPIVLLSLLNIIFYCSSNDKQLSRIMRNCFCEIAFDILLLLKNQ